MSEQWHAAHEPRPLPSVLAELVQAGYSGSLVAHSGDIRREILLSDGEIRAARSSLEEEKLGLWLVNRGVISDGDRALSLLAQGGPDAPPLGHLLVLRGSVDLQELDIELEALTTAIIQRAAAAGQTSYELVEPCDGPLYLDTLPGTTTPQLILLAARSFSGIEEQERALGSPEQAVQPAVGLSDLLYGLSLTPTEAFLLSRIEGPRTIASLLSVSALPREQAIPTLYALQLAGIVTIGPDDGRAAGRSRAEPVDESTLDRAQLEERTRIRKLAGEVRQIDHYQALGVGRKATVDIIDDAWLSLRNRFHPDRALTPHLRDMRQELTTVLERGEEANEVLSDRPRRHRYDRILASLSSSENVLETAERQEATQEARAELVEANFKRAEEFVRDGEVYLAIQLLEQACLIDPRPAQLVKLAKLLARNPLWSERALDTLNRATEVDPSNADAWFELARLWQERGQPERQRKALERAIAAQPEHADACQEYTQLFGSQELKRVQEQRIRCRD